ncbi:MAG: metallo-mystery pair system four-Cys motif protein, partial [Tistrella sp.]|nr:metallo-mystery pair system four-Cys motif protein [Tistrella sp.]
MMTCRLTRLATLLLLLAAGPVLAAERSVTIGFGIVAGAAPVGC